MRLLETAVTLAVVLFFAALRPCLAQQTEGPRTLENLITPDKPLASPASPETNQPNGIVKRPAGTAVRPKDGIQHPDLNNAWDNYDAVVAKVAEDLRAVMDKHFDAATTRGDLDAALKWKEIKAKFEKEGVLPDDTEMKATVNAAAVTYAKAKDDLIKAYDSIVKTLTKERQIDEAKAARDEKLSLVSVAVPRQKPSQKQDTSEVAWEDITAAMQGGTKRGPFVLIEPDGERVVSGKPYTPPLIIEYVCATSHNNIRLGYACDYMIFNWELNRNELRIDGGPAGGRHVMNAGAVPSGKMVTIRQVVLPGEMTVFVDGQKRASWAGDFSQVRDLIEVFGYDSEVHLKTVRVLKPPQ